MEYVALNNGVKMPMEGYGVFQITDARQCRQCVADALESGYRLIDTAAAYHNETAVGEAVGSSGIPRVNQEIGPLVNQVEIHPFYQQADALRVMGEYGVVPQAWGPLSEGQKDIFRHKTLEAIAARHGKTTAQVILKWHIQRGVSVIPKTVRKERMRENLDIWDFVLTQREMDSIGAMDVGHSEIIDHHSWCTARQLNKIKIH